MNDKYKFITWGVVIAASLFGAILDVRKGILPNVLTIPLVIIAFSFTLLTGGLTGFLNSLLGCIVLALPYFVLFLFAGGGAGDAKMMGAVGSWVGLQQGLIVLLCVCLASVMIGFAIAFFKKQAKILLSSVIVDLYTIVIIVLGGKIRLKVNVNGQQSPGELTMPYGVAIFAGVCLAGGYFLCI